jgi:heme/copper-type cytochrome/quinol oxidase subunit 2
MKVNNWVVPVVALACAMVASGAAVALEDQSSDAGKGSAFKSRVFEIKEKGEVAVLLSFAAGRPVTVTTNGEKQTDVHLFIQDGDKEVGKDTSPGPKCEVKFTPTKEGTFKVLVKNEGPGPNTVTLQVKATDRDETTEGSKESGVKSTVFEMKEKGEVAVLLPFAAGRPVTVTTNGKKQTDVYLFIQDEDSKEVGKDTSPGPKCEVKFTPTKEGTFKLLVKNEGPGANRVTLEVKALE